MQDFPDEALVDEQGEFYERAEYHTWITKRSIKLSHVADAMITEVRINPLKILSVESVTFIKRGTYTGFDIIWIWWLKPSM